MTRNRLTSGLTAEQLRQYNSLADEQTRRLFLESIDIIDLTATPTPESAAQEHSLPYSFLPDDYSDDPVRQSVAQLWEQLMMDYAVGKDQRQLRDLIGQLLSQQQIWFDAQVKAIQAVVDPLIGEQQRLAQSVGELPNSLLKPSDVEQVIRQQVDVHWRDVPGRLSGEVETFVKKLVPAVVRVENPSDSLLRLTRYLTMGLVIAGLGLGGIFFWGLTRQAKLSERTPGWAKYQYLRQKAMAVGDRKLLNELKQADHLYRSGTFHTTLENLETVNSARRQQQYYRQEETEHQRQLQRNRH